MTSDFGRHHDRSVSGVTPPERSDGDLVPAHLLSAWEAAYQAYVSVPGRTAPRNAHDRQELARLSAQVAIAWRQLASAPGTEWWLVAAFSTAAEAMEQQARDMGTPFWPSTSSEAPDAGCQPTEIREQREACNRGA